MSEDTQYPQTYRVPNIPNSGVRAPYGAHAVILEADRQGRFVGFQHFGTIIQTTPKACFIEVDGQSYPAPWQNLFLQAIGPELDGFDLLLDRVTQVKGIAERLYASHSDLEGFRAFLGRVDQLQALGEILQTG